LKSLFAFFFLAKTMDVPEIVAEILSYCVDIPDYWSWSLVCHQWRYFVSTSVEALCREHYPIKIDKETLSHLPGPNRWLHIANCLFKYKFLVCTNRYVSSAPRLAERLKKLGLRNVDFLEEKSFPDVYYDENQADEATVRSMFSKYDGIIFATNYAWDEESDIRRCWGNIFKECLDRGVGVIQLVFAHCSGSENLGGAWEESNMSAIVPLAFEEDGDVRTQLYKEVYIDVLQPKHFLWNGVPEYLKKDYTKGNGYISTGKPHPDGTIIANIANIKKIEHQLPFAVVLDKFKGKSLALNFHPEQEKEEDLLLFNAFVFVARPEEYENSTK